MAPSKNVFHRYVSSGVGGFTTNLQKIKILIGSQ